MKVLHLFSNWKVTGPAESVMNLVGALRARGVNALFASGENPFGGENLIVEKAAELGLDVIRDWHLRKHFKSLTVNWEDISNIRKFLEKEKVDIIHCHLSNDHHIGGRAAKKLKNPIPVVRSVYEAGRVGGGLRSRFFLPGITDAFIAFSKKAIGENKTFFGLDSVKALKLDGAEDLLQFNPRKSRRNLRDKLDLPPGGFVLGIVTRIQKRRRFDIILEAVRRAREIVGDFTFLVVGRGTQVEQVLLRPAKKLGIDSMVRDVGYLTGSDYIDALSAMDAKICLGGGSDQTCPAVRQAMAMGTPVIAGRTGMLPELVVDNERGLVVDMNPEDVAYAICRMARDELMRIRLGRKARAYAREYFDLDRQARLVRSFYRRLQGKR